MSSFTSRGELLAGSVLAVLAGLLGAVPTTPAVGQQKAAPPNFSSSQFGWVRVGQAAPTLIRCQARCRPSPTIRRILSLATAPGDSRPAGSRI